VGLVVSDISSLAHIFSHHNRSWQQNLVQVARKLFLLSIPRTYLLSTPPSLRLLPLFKSSSHLPCFLCQSLEDSSSPPIFSICWLFFPFLPCSPLYFPSINLQSIHLSCVSRLIGSLDMASLHPGSAEYPDFPNQCMPSIVPPGVDPALADFREFYPYIPNEVKHRKRTTQAQLEILEDMFSRDKKPNGASRSTLARELNMTPRGVQVRLHVSMLHLWLLIVARFYVSFRSGSRTGAYFEPKQ
jgi:Homeodomain